MDHEHNNMGAVPSFISASAVSTLDHGARHGYGEEVDGVGGALWRWGQFHPNHHIRTLRGV